TRFGFKRCRTPRCQERVYRHVCCVIAVRVGHNRCIVAEVRCIYLVVVRPDLLAGRGAVSAYRSFFDGTVNIIKNRTCRYWPVLIANVAARREIDTKQLVVMAWSSSGIVCELVCPPVWKINFT